MTVRDIVTFIIGVIGMGGLSLLAFLFVRKNIRRGILFRRMFLWSSWIDRYEQPVAFWLFQSLEIVAILFVLVLGFWIVVVSTMMH